MRLQYFFLWFFVLAFITNVNAQTVQVVDGAIQAAFSVSSTTQVFFSQGNLQYRPSTKTWRFAEHQYDIRQFEDHDLFNEGEINATYKQWFDTFGYATSGWFTEIHSYKPYLRSLNRTDYYIEESPDNDMTGEYANADWGVYNAISNGGNKKGLWRTLTVEEWEYLLVGRPLAEELCKIVMIDGSYIGLCILPDNYFDVYDPSFKFIAQGIHKYNNFNQYYTYLDADLTMEEWEALETKGVVFLWLSPPSTSKISTMYWTATHHTAIDVDRRDGKIIIDKNDIPNLFNYVRLVQDVK